jgi:two-component system, OmpR family, sensor histidine kinase VicK
VGTLLELISGARYRIDACVDHTRPPLVAEIKQLRHAVLRTKTEGIKLRYLTEITMENLYYCKELLSIVDELRHLAGIKGNFYVSENEYAAPAVFHEKGRSADMMIYSSAKEIVQHQQSIFESIWNASTSAERRIKEIEGNINLGTTEIIDNPYKTKALFIDLIKSAKSEILLILPTINAFLREYRIGAMQLLKELSSGTTQELDEQDEENNVKENRTGRKKISIRILTPTNDLVGKIIDELDIGSTIADNAIGVSSTVTNLKDKSSGGFPSFSSQDENNIQPFQIRLLESQPRYNVTTVTILIVDRKASLAIEKVDDSKTEFIEAVGLSTYSTSTPTIASYVSIFENFWSQLELYQKLRANERMEREFINLAAHELRTPAQAILGYTELAMMETDENYEVDSEKGGYIAAAYRNALRLQRLTKEILDVARIESNSLKLNKDRFDLVEKISDVINDILHTRVVNAKKVNKTEIVFNKPETALLVNADRVRLYEVISNLLTNAINSTKNKGKIIIFIQVDKCAKNDISTGDNDSSNNNKMCAVVNIKDNGTGIDSEIEPRLFTKFATKSESGLGLGLYISKSIIEAHGGKIWGENNKDSNGATFAFSLYTE